MFDRGTVTMVYHLTTLPLIMVARHLAEDCRIRALQVELIPHIYARTTHMVSLELDDWVIFFAWPLCLAAICLAIASAADEWVKPVAYLTMTVSRTLERLCLCGVACLPVCRCSLLRSLALALKRSSPGFYT